MFHKLIIFSKSPLLEKFREILFGDPVSLELISSEAKFYRESIFIFVMKLSILFLL